jgi:hypothetical protein
LLVRCDFFASQPDISFLPRSDFIPISLLASLIFLRVGFRVQCTFLNVESNAFLDKNIAIKLGKIGDGMILEGTVFRVQCAFPNMESSAFLYEIWQ